MEKIQIVREALKLKQKEFSTELGISQSYLSAMETGRKQVTSKLANVLFKKFNVSPEWLYNDNGDIFNITMCNIDGVKNGVNLMQDQDNVIDNNFKNSPGVKKVRSFWKLVREHDKDLDKTLDALDKLDDLNIDLIYYLRNIDDIINNILEDVQNVHYKELNNPEYIKNAVKKLSFLKEQHHNIDQLSISIESVLAFIDHDNIPALVGVNSKVKKPI